MDDLGIDVRKEVLTSSLIFESTLTSFLGTFLNIKDYKNSRSIGNRSGSLSFNQKVDLIIDIGELNLEERNKFITFMEIRNQFMHNADAKTYIDCFSFIDGKEKFILKLYPQPEELTREQKLQNATIELAGNIMILTLTLIRSIKKKLNRDYSLEVLEKSQEAMRISMAELRDELNVEFELSKDEKIGYVVSKKFYEKYRKVFWDLIKK
ncbi:hypothetical protein [Flavobacterium sp.]|jgi:hypothetical protein|uniref:hypothetical protein n=1 Tax=Flavobacterium sp. TaxID=239 RepID=UPI0037C140D1